MTTTQAGITAYAVVIAWAIVMLMLLRWAQANAAAQAAARKTAQEDAAERARAAAYWASPEGRQRKAQMDAEQRYWEWQQAARAKPQLHVDDVRYVSMGVRLRRPAPTPTFSPAPVQPQPACIAPPACDLPRPVVQPARNPAPKPAPVPVQPPGILVPNWPTPKRQRTEAQQ